ncbi:hypothetical protein BRADI_4g04251v3 [Brachypodium distachyon]|uniref:RNase H type-1 domain-containing protein n=1 Tax=Brachypodium distachyon TaxID=15368 RepID=A0A0Q3PB30_BRADI|nr:hypothetical protein BRADI_4g04251v3 [Brachypodium distachyon]
MWWCGGLFLLDVALCQFFSGAFLSMEYCFWSCGVYRRGITVLSGVWKDYLCLRAEEAEALACLLELEACVGNVRGPLVIKGDYVNT